MKTSSSISQKHKKSIALASIFAATAAASALAGEIKTPEQAIAAVTGEGQAKLHSMCVAVTPYFITSRTPTGVASAFVAVQVNGISDHSQERGECDSVGENDACKPGFVKILSTAPIACSVPIGL